ncbi:tetratricopeptide repeat protein [Turicibacter sanguinis]|uniref:tetratricopeptide repeat protein n=1 Tax=Turicibacter sanguinis TaxID=154288 RepID=UPI00189A94D9|nr:tetratricopeptide repeat protein [Turicibacter sanguinis]
MEIVSMEDVNYLSQQSSGDINMILSGMIALMNNTDDKVATLDSQKWFQRMIKTVTGKNKITLNEIQKNHDKLNAYMSEAIAELYNRNCIDHKVIMSLGTQLNEVYVNNLQLKQMLGAFINKLNQKIDSIDNFYMLTTEIDQGVYSNNSPLISICKVISQFDNRILQDNRKLDIIRRSLMAQKIINSEEVLLIDYLMNIIKVPIDEVGEIYLELNTIHDNFMANILLKTMDKYYFLPDIARKLKNKELLIREILQEEGLDDTVTLSLREVYDEFVNSKIEIRTDYISIGETKAEVKLEEAEQLFLDCKFDDAFKLFKLLAEQGNGRAMYFMGEYYIHHYGHVVNDIETGMKWRQKGNELGDTLSSLNLAYSFPEDSPERSKILDKMFEPTLKLAEKGDVFAQNEIADLYLLGYIEESDEEKKLYWLKKSAEAGHWGAMNKLGEWLEDNEKYSEAIKWYRKAAEKGYASAENQLGLCYLSGIGVEVNKYKAFQWFEKSAEHGLAVGQNNLATCYELGEGVEQDLDKAKKWYRTAFENGYDNAGTMLGLLAQKSGYHTEAVRWYKKAVENGDAEAQNLLGLCYDNGIGIEVNKFEAFHYFMKAAEQGLAVGQNNLALCYELGEGVEQDFDKAKKWYKTAFENGYDNAGTMLGLLAQKSGYHTEAVRWYKKAAENGDAEAQNYLGLCYDNGQGISQDEKIAFEWFMKAAKQGNPAAQYNVGFCYHNGEGMEKTDKWAKHWLRKSAEQGYDSAINKLREWYEENTSSSNGYLNSPLTISQNTYTAIKRECKTFKNAHDSSSYDESYKLKSVFHLLDEAVYLAHDDTIFKNGKNGFAITVCGVYCRCFMDSYTTYVSFIDLAYANCIYIKDSKIYADENPVAYISGVSNNEREDLKVLFEQIATLVREDLNLKNGNKGD